MPVVQAVVDLDAGVFICKEAVIATGEAPRMRSAHSMQAGCGEEGRRSHRELRS